MIKEAIEHVEKRAASTIQQAHGRAYVETKLQPLPSPAALATVLEFHSLSGLVAYYASTFDRLNEEEHAFVVDGPDCVRIVGKLVGEFRQREELAVAEPYVSQGFPFGRHVDLETFITGLQSHFVQDENTAAILKVVGNTTSSAVQTVQDDGVSQQVTAKAGIARVENVKVPNPVELRPFRTFPEVWQPSSKYVLRMKSGQGEQPTAALFEVGDCKWKHAAVEDIEAKIGQLLEKAGASALIFA